MPEPPVTLDLLQFVDGLMGGDRTCRMRRVVLVVEHSHVLNRLYATVGPTPVADLSDLRHSTPGWRRRRSATLEATERVASLIENDDDVLLFGTAEGWLISGVARNIRARFPNYMIGLQHGIQGRGGLLGHIAVRRLRRLLSDFQARVFRFTLIGAGFPNTEFDGFVTLGAGFSADVRRLFPGTETTEERNLVFGERLPHTGRPADVLFVGQDLSSYTKMAKKVEESVLRRLANAQNAGRSNVVYRPHPLSKLNDVEIPDGITLSSADSFWRHVDDSTVVVSYFSSCLLEARMASLRVVSIKVPRIPRSFYSVFRNVVPLSDFVGGWDFEHFSDLDI